MRKEIEKIIEPWTGVDRDNVVSEICSLIVERLNNMITYEDSLYCGECPTIERKQIIKLINELKEK